jgi:hypothetical protein
MHELNDAHNISKLSNNQIKKSADYSSEALIELDSKRIVLHPSESVFQKGLGKPVMLSFCKANNDTSMLVC